jgi:hypothetical protein
MGRGILFWRRRADTRDSSVAVFRPLIPPPREASHTESTEICMITEERETGALIGSDKVEGTAVFGSNDERIGSIERVVIEKTSGKVSHAVLSFGRFLGVGSDHYPLPWNSLKYDTELGGYRTGITLEQLNGAPKYSSDSDWNWSDQTPIRSVNDYYGNPRYLSGAGP